MAADTAELIRTLSERGASDEALALARASLPAAAGATRGRLLLAQAAVLAARGDFQAALHDCVDASELFAGAQARPELCDALVQTAGTLRAAGEHAGAVSLLEQAELLARELHDPLRLSRVLRQLGVVCSVLRRHQHALSSLGEAVALAEAHASGDEARSTRLSLLNARSRELQMQEPSAEKRQRALGLMQAWAELGREATAAGQTRVELLAWGNQAILAHEAGEVAQAIESLHALLPRYQAAGMRPNEGLTHTELGRCHETLGDGAQARAHYRAALAILREAGVHDDLMQTLEGLARCEERQGDLAAALAALKELRALEAERSHEQARDRVAQRELRIELARLDGQWARQAVADPLTGLASRHALAQWLAEHWPRVEQGQTLALALLDLDHFRRINDELGQGVGDSVLQIVAGVLQAHCRGGDLAVRFGGEEFVLALAGVDQRAAEAVAQRLLAAVSAYDWRPLGSTLAVTASVGVADAREVMDAESLLTLADQRLHRAKREGRNRVAAGR